jgi:hypothetical protein
VPLKELDYADTNWVGSVRGSQGKGAHGRAFDLGPTGSGDTLRLVNSMHPEQHHDMRETFQPLESIGQCRLQYHLRNNIFPGIPHWLDFTDSIPNIANRVYNYLVVLHVVASL